MNPGDCRHFNGIQHDRCKAGVLYRSLPKPHAFSLPCVNRDSRVDSCEACEPWSELEAETHMAALHSAVDDVLRGLCGECGEVLVTTTSECGRATVSSCPEHGFAMRGCRRVGEP